MILDCGIHRMCGMNVKWLVKYCGVALRRFCTIDESPNGVFIPLPLGWLGLNLSDSSLTYLPRFVSVHVAR